MSTSKLNPRAKRIEVDQLLSFERGDDQEHRIGPVGSRFVKLDLVDHKLFVQGGQRHRLFDLAEIVEASLEEILVG